MVSVPALAAVALSPPHSEHSETETEGTDNTGVIAQVGQLDSDIDKPMDLSSGGAGLGITQLFSGGSNTMPISEHPLLNARRLADLVRQQHRQSEQRERESKRKWEETEDEEENNPANDENVHHPVDLIRSRWEAGGGAVSQQSDRESPGPGSPAGSSSGSESGQSGQSGSGGGREEKRRRLDMLLNKKFDKMTSSMDTVSNPILMSTPPPSERETSPASDRRPSTESTGGGHVVVAGDRKNRRKQSQPGSNPPSPPSISIRPHSDLFPPAATSTPRHKSDPNSATNGSNVPADYSPARKMSRSQSPVPPSNNTVNKSPVAAKLFAEEKENKDVLKNQLLQVCNDAIIII